MILHLKNTPFSQDAGTLGWRTVSTENRQPAEAAAFVLPSARASSLQPSASCLDATTLANLCQRASPG